MVDVAMKIFEKIKCRTFDKGFKLRAFYFLWFRLVLRNKRMLPNQYKNVVYLKINRLTDYSILNIQHWMEIGYYLGAYIYIVCDNPKLEREIYRRVIFREDNFSFIPSMRTSLKDRVRVIATRYWIKATFAHLTTIYHAACHHYDNIWSIDADDTTICEYPEKVADLLVNVMAYADKNNISAMSLDMWRSRTEGRHWSLGVVYFKGVDNIKRHIDSIQSIEWFSPFVNIDVNSNLDWLFNYFKNEGILKVETFYYEDAYFIHWGEFFRNPIGTAYCYWADGQLIFPMIGTLYKGFLKDIFPISDCIKIASGFNFGDSQKFINNEVSTIKYFPDKILRLHNIERKIDGIMYWA